MTRKSHTPYRGKRKYHYLSYTPEYKCWKTMFQRCYNPKNKKYPLYGARGIKVCKRWLKFENFYADMGKRPWYASLERINNSKGYSPNNCKWASASEQARNRGIPVNNKTGCKGVTRREEWIAFINIKGRKKHLGSFKTFEEAKSARLAAEKKHNYPSY